MVIQEGYFYHLMDSFFREVNDKTLMSNKENGGYRPHFFSIRDKKNPDIFWMVPISSRYEKYKAFREMQVKKYGRCTKVVLGKFAGKQCAFLVQNAFPTTADYFDHVHTRFNQPATITPKLKGEIVRCLTSNFAMHKRGIHLFFADIDRLYTLMERKLQSERTRCSLRRVSRKRNLCRKPLRHKDSYMKKRIFDNLAKQKIQALVQGALAILPFDAMDRIQYRYEHIGDGKFLNTNTAAVNNFPYILTINIDWYENTEEADIKFMMRHEARHLYQQNQIEKLTSGKPVNNTPDEIIQWSKEFTPGNYVNNSPGREKEHFTQACEIDAYVYASFICNTENIKNDGSISFSIVQYPFIADLIEERVIDILNNTPMDDLLKYRDFYSKQQV